MNSHEPDEVAAIRARYERRPTIDPRYSLFNPSEMSSWQERVRGVTDLLRRAGLTEPGALTALEIGCGGGGNLLDLVRIGLHPENLMGIELLPARAAIARSVLPPGVAVLEGDAASLPIEAESRTIVLLSTVLSSVLDTAFQQHLADVAWRAVRPGGAVLCYDFIVDNPRNHDVRGVPLRRVRELFPDATPTSRRMTLAPPLARAATRIHPGLYPVLNAIPLLRSHRMTWLAKAGPGTG